MKALTATNIMKPGRSVDWTKERIAALGTPEVKQLRINAERLNDPEIMERCDEVLGTRPRSGVRKAAQPKQPSAAKLAKAAAAKPGEAA